MLELNWSNFLSLDVNSIEQIEGEALGIYLLWIQLNRSKSNGPWTVFYIGGGVIKECLTSHLENTMKNEFTRALDQIFVRKFHYATVEHANIHEVKEYLIRTFETFRSFGLNSYSSDISPRMVNFPNLSDIELVKISTFTESKQKEKGKRCIFPCLSFIFPCDTKISFKLFTEEITYETHQVPRILGQTYQRL